MSAAKIATALGDARRESRAWRCRCPLHGGRSLVMRDGEWGHVLATCWGGKPQADKKAPARRLRRLAPGAGSERADGCASPRPPQGMDFNDLLKPWTPSIKEDAR